MSMNPRRSNEGKGEESVNLPSAVITVREALLQAVLILVLSACLGIGVNALRSDRIPLVQDWSL